MPGVLRTISSNLEGFWSRICSLPTTEIDWGVFMIAVSVLVPAMLRLAT
jgi:hypothetical protein